MIHETGQVSVCAERQLFVVDTLHSTTANETTSAKTRRKKLRNHEDVGLSKAPITNRFHELFTALKKH